MKFHFLTNNLSEKFYTRFIHTYYHYTLSRKTKRQYKKELDALVWVIKPSSEARHDPLFHGKNGVGGATGPSQITLYLEDVQENIHDPVQRVFRKNNEVICHEFGHWILYVTNQRERVPLRNTDYSNVRAGQLRPFFYAEVHDRDIEDHKFLMKFHFIDWKKFKILRRKFRVLDFRDLV